MRSFSLGEHVFIAIFIKAMIRFVGILSQIALSPWVDPWMFSANPGDHHEIAEHYRC
jgi:hypothetical protein